MMRIRIVQRPPPASIDGIQLNRFEPGSQYEVGNTLGALMLAEEWAEPVPLDEPALLVPFSETDPFEPRPMPQPGGPPNLFRETYPPYLDQMPATVAADFVRRRRRNR